MQADMGHEQQIYHGRAFELATGEIVLPCEFCGNPVFKEQFHTHTCPGLGTMIVEVMEQRERDAWKDMV